MSDHAQMAIDLLKLVDEKDAEIERLRQEAKDKDLYIRLESETVVKQQAEIERLREANVRLQEALAADPMDQSAEIERLRSALETILTVPVGEGAAASMSKIALQALRVREALEGEAMSVSDTGHLSALDAVLYNRPAGRNIIDFARETIERLREEVAETEGARALNANALRLAQEKIERLRGLLREGIALMSSRNREEWRKRVREALGDE